MLSNTSISIHYVLALALSFVAVLADPQVSLGYATYEGTALSNGINQFLGMRYAVPPICENRFKLAKGPQNETGVVEAKEHGPVCLPVQNIDNPPLPVQTSEDCLFIDVYAPANASASRDGLPVMLWIQGGGFVELINYNYNGTGLIEATNGNVIIVSFNYRIGPYGFLASKELAQEGNLNMGLHDQRMAIKWVNQHIDKFGGDPNALTIFGTSAGAGSVLLQSLAYSGTPPPEQVINWNASIGESVYIPPVYSIDQLQHQYDQLLTATNCTDLTCLRSLSSSQIQSANINRPFFNNTNLPLFPYNPVIDGSFLTDYPLYMLHAGNFSTAKPIMLGGTSTEGTIFASQANTTQDINDWLTTQFPLLTSDDLAQAELLYQDIPSTMPGVNVPESPFYHKLSAIYSDIAFACPTLAFATTFAEKRGSVHLFRDNIRDPIEVAAGFIVPHTWALQAVWGPEYSSSIVALPGADSYDVGGVNRAVVGEVQGYWTSFARTLGDPNLWRENGTVVWEAFDESRGMRLRLETNATAMESVSGVEYARCAFWAGISERTHI